MLDIKTLALLNFIIGIICAGVVAVIWSQNRGRFAGISFWLVGVALWAAGLFLMILRGLVPDLLSIPFANTILQGGVLILFIGLERFTGEKGWQIHNYVLLAVFMAVIAYFGIVQPNLWMREIAVSAITMIFTFQCSWLLLRRVEPGIRQITRLTGIVFAVYSAFSFARLVLTIITPEQSNDFFKPRAVNALAMTGYIVISVCLVNSLILMLNRRLVVDSRKDEETLRESEERFDQLAKQSGTIVWEVDTQGLYTYVSNVSEPILGYRPDELVGQMHFYDLHPESGKELFKQAALAVFDRKEPFINLENVGLTKNGHHVWFSTNGIPLLNTDGTLRGYRGSDTDITARRLAEESLQKSEANYRHLFDNSPAAIYQIDFRTGKFIKANDVFCEYIGCSQEEIPSLSPYDILTNDSKQLFLERLRKMGSDEKVAENAEYEIIDKNGKHRWFQLIGKYIYDSEGLAGADVVAHDITDRKLADEKLRQSEEYFRCLIEDSLELVTVITEDGTILYESSSSERILGYKPEELVGKNTMEYIHPDDLEKAVAALSPSQTGETQRSIEIRFRRKDGSWLLLQAEGRDLRNHPSVRGIVINSRDITSRKQAEEEKHDLQERLNRAEKMEALGTLAGGVAHDLNNVLGIVVGYSEMILDEVEETSPLRRPMVNIFNGGQKAAAIVDDLLTLARRGVPGSNILNLNKIIKDSQQSPELSKLLSHHLAVKIKTDLDSDLLNISGSSVHLNKSLYNLISNACEAMNKGGILTIKTTNQYLDKPMSGYNEIREGDYVVLSISDTGEGISEKDLKRIFEPFYTKKIMGRSGTGLGLAVVWGTVTDHNGYINVQSEEGKGSTFTLYFPVTREEIPDEAIVIDISEYLGNGQSILIVDDLKDQRDLATDMLKKLNYNVDSVKSGEEAILYLKEHQTDLIVLDMIMDPGMDGLDTYSILHSR